MPDTVESLKIKCDEYEEILGVGGKDIAKRAFLSLCRIVNEQTKILDKFSFDVEIIKTAKDDKFYDRVSDIVVKMPKTIAEINNLRTELKITKKEEESAFVDGIAEKRS